MDRNEATGKITVGRLAPSPTGGLHVGHARTFLAAWLAARSAGGRVILRIEDLDATRVRSGADQGMIADLRWLGLDWDEGPDIGGPHAPYHQSTRLDAYRATLATLSGLELVYPCTCTRAEIARVASAPHEGEEGPVYPGTCSHRSAREAEYLERPFSWRFRATSFEEGSGFLESLERGAPRERARPPHEVTWDDMYLGLTTLSPAQAGGDFIVARSSGEVAYQLAVVHDDAAMGVTQVIRGDDLVASTPRQLLLYQALGLRAPSFGHIPLVIGPDGRRLAKRDGSIKLAALRESGVDPEALIGWSAATLGILDHPAPASSAELIGRFSLKDLPALSPVFSAETDLSRAVF